MIRLSGLTLGKDIQIKYIGLRPGEKLYEELLNKEENTIPTHHPLILTAKVREYELPDAENEITTLINMTGNSSNMEIVKKMKNIVPEYKSQNSLYEQLDI
jgi:FlaA1/EpsC-like NDP-sugar epimerase